MNIFTEHPNDTENPQTYFQHGFFAITNSAKLVVGGLAGIIHGFCPWWLKFYTSSMIIRSFNKLVLSRRHMDELKEVFGDDNVTTSYWSLQPEQKTIVIRIPLKD